MSETENRSPHIDYVPDVKNFTYQRGNYGKPKEIRMSNIKWHKVNEQVELVRNALAKMYPSHLLPGYEFDDAMIRCVERWQRDNGYSDNGVLNKEQTMLIAEQDGNVFEVVGPDVRL